MADDTWSQCPRCESMHPRSRNCDAAQLFAPRERRDATARLADGAEVEAATALITVARDQAEERLTLALSALGALPSGRCRCPRWTPQGCCLDADPMNGNRSQDG